MKLTESFTDAENGQLSRSQPGFREPRSAEKVHRTSEWARDERRRNGIGSQAEYEFGRIPIFPVSHGSFRSIPECTTPADMVEREVDQMARDVMQIPDGLSRQRGKQEVDGLTTASLYTLGEGAFAVSAGKNISDVLWGQ